MPFASWGRRAAALIVDGLFWIVVWVFVALPGVDLGIGFALFVLPALYHWLMVGTWGRTLGKMALGIRV